jgi:hypothetical protein
MDTTTKIVAVIGAAAAAVLASAKISQRMKEQKQPEIVPEPKPSASSQPKPKGEAMGNAPVVKATQAEASTGDLALGDGKSSPTENIFWSLKKDCIIIPSNVRVVNGRRYMTTPVFDAKYGVWARLRYRDALSFLKENGWQPISEAEWYALSKDPINALILEPCTLVHTKEDQYKMRSLAYARKHDACVDKQLKNIPWDRAKILLNFGKQWVEGRNGQPTPAGKSTNFGWFRTKDGTNDKGEFRAKGTPIQTPGQAHEADYGDYSQLSQGSQAA